MEADVIIIGAGAAGLMAARTLAEAGKKVLVLEARDRIGGRIRPLSKDEFGYSAQGGGEFVHGNAPVTNVLAKEIGLTLQHEIEWWNVFDGEPRIHEWVSSHDELLESKLKEVKTDMTVTQFLDTYFSGSEYAALRDIVCKRVQGYDAADPDKASVMVFREEVLDESTWLQKNIKEGYSLLIEFLFDRSRAAGAEFKFESVVKKIQHGKHIVDIYCEDGARYRCKRALITVPIPLYKDMEFVPALPEKINAAGQIGFGHVIKILIRFRKKWWIGAREMNFEKLFFMFSNEAIPTWWTQYPEPHATLTGWLAGPNALAMSEKSDDEILELAFQSLSNIFKISRVELKHELVTARVMNWQKDPFARGAYSYATPGGENAVQILRAPVDDTLYFAGEALFEGSASATVEGALATGLEASLQILTH